VTIELEAARNERGDALRASGNFEDAIALTASEMVVVLRAGRFIPGWFARELDRDHHAIGDERSERSINGRCSQSRHLRLGAGEDLRG
jgi:hypothetical protein